MSGIDDKFFDLAIVDPPYGIGAGGKNFQSGTSNNSKIYRENDWDSKPPDEAYFNELKRVSKNQIIWGGNYFLEFLGSCRCFIFWDKNQPMENYSDGELAWTSFDKVAKVFKKDWYGAIAKEREQLERIHPTQKPVALYKWLLKNYAKEGDKILDTHLGSGSIALACHDYKFELTATEIDAEYFKETCKRFSNHVAQTSLF
ncbi:MAG: DNA methyltransferase [bacterium]